MGAYSKGILDKRKPNSTTPTSEPTRNFGSSAHCTCVNENTIRDELLAICVMPCMGMIKLGLKNRGNTAISNMPPPKPMTPAMTDVQKEINPNVYSIYK